MPTQHYGHSRPTDSHQPVADAPDNQTPLYHAVSKNKKRGCGYVVEMTESRPMILRQGGDASRATIHLNGWQKSLP